MTQSRLEVCTACGRPLAECNTIWAAYGELFCSEECGKHAVKDFIDVSEEITPADIGIIAEGGN